MKKSPPRDPNLPVNVAVVGLGFMGTVHLRAHLANPAARVVALCDSKRAPSNGVLAGVSGNIGESNDIPIANEVAIYRELDEVLAKPEVELVDLCTPTLLHPEQTIAALNAGKHVLCEKPMARTSEAARQVLDAARTARGFFMPAMCIRFWPGWSLIKQIVDEQTYGKVHSASFRRLSETPAWSQKTYASGNETGGALFDLHIHDTDFVQYLFGRPVSVFSSGVQRSGTAIDHVVTQYHFANGPVVCAEGSWLLSNGFKMAFTVHCERATLDYDSARGAEALHLIEPGKTARVIESSGDGYREEIDFMLRCIQRGKRPSIVTAEDGLSVLQICEAEERSAMTGQVVRL